MEVGRGNIVLKDILTADSEPQMGLNPVEPVEASGSNPISAERMDEVFNRIKTHFPPAKIKKIMQTDDDIGKVSQATPVIAGRSLEFFMAMLVERSGEIAREMNTKRITADILKKTIMSDEKFDFLRDFFGEEGEVEDGEGESN